MIINIVLNTESNTASIIKNENGVKSLIDVDIKDLFESIELSKDKRSLSEENFKPIKSIIHQKRDGYEIIQTIQIGKNSYLYIVKADKRRVPFYIYNKFFGLCGMPTMLFAIKVVNGYYSKMAVTVLENDNIIISETTPLFYYPFSNVNAIGDVCTGSNKIRLEIDSLEGLKKVIGYFYEIPNTSEAFNHLRNSKGIAFRDLANLLSNNDFNSNLLVSNNNTKTYREWLNKLIQ